MAKKNKFNSVLAHKVKEDIAYEKAQRQLKDDHNIVDENVVVVEKSNNYKFTINSLKALFQLSCRIIIIILCVIGLIGLIYPAPRSSLFMIINDALVELQSHLEPLIAVFHNLSQALYEKFHLLQEYIK